MSKLLKLAHSAIINFASDNYTLLQYKSYGERSMTF